MFHLAIYYDFREQDVGCAVSAHKIYNVVAKIKRNQMQRRNTVEEVLRLNAERGYTVFHRNCEDSNVLSDIVVAHPTSIEMIRTLSYVLIMDTTYKTNKYNMPLLECVRMTPTGKTSQWQQLLCAMNMQRYTDRFFNKSSNYILHLLCQIVRVQLSMKGLDLSSVAFWGRDNEPDRKRTFSSLF
ncbi:hypothetical protein M9H77_11972 [Catharanthus roseus]|uniref:Uncharacterized protein n=1 Tax=Catharanthus roseus TaxID=4058 RepID=A0ACC0BG86_CATRO|nr:hypothetical protein M9H77_11972 [Catharanthus roseus]